MPEENKPAEVSGPIDRSKSVSWEDVKKSAATTSEEAKPEVKEPESVKTETEPEPEATVDYEAELAKYKEKAEREKRLREYERDERKRLEKQLRDKTEEIIETEEEKPDLDELVERKLEKVRIQERAEVIEDTLDELSDNPKERELIKTIYENKLRPSGFSRNAIKQDLIEAKLIANRNRLETLAMQKAKEKVKAEIAQERAMQESASTGGSLGRKPPEAPSNLTPEELRWLSRVGKTKIEG